MQNRLRDFAGRAGFAEWFKVAESNADDGSTGTIDGAAPCVFRARSGVRGWGDRAGEANMRRWRTALAIMTGILLSLGGAPSFAQAQFSFGAGRDPSGLDPNCPAPPHAPPKESPFSMTDSGQPNAFTSLLDVRQRRFDPVFMHFNRTYRGGILPGIFHRTPTAATPADFPNPMQASTEPVSPWTVREEGMPNGFTELCDPKPRPGMHFLHGTRLLFTEMLEPCPQVMPPWCLTFRGEYLGWRVSNGPSSAVLLTTNNNPTLAELGQLDSPRTSILVDSGDDTFDYGTMPGYRLTMGLSIGYLPPLEVSGFSFRRRAVAFEGGSQTNPDQLLAIPFQDVQPGFIIPGTGVGTERSLVVALPLNSIIGGQGGTVSIASSLNFWGIEALTALPIGCSDCWKVDFLLGYRHLQLNERIDINTLNGGQVGSVIFNGIFLPQGLFGVSTSDRFATTNRFDGVQLGVRSALTSGRWSLLGDAKVAIGMSAHSLNVQGSSTLFELVPGRSAQTVPGGILALPSNSGTATLSTPNFAPEFNVSLSYRATSNCRFFVGYNFLYWNRVIRPGDYISNLIDARQIPTDVFFTPGVVYGGPNRTTALQRRDFTAQGIFLGMEIGF
jgi:hypothetical protein